LHVLFPSLAVRRLLLLPPPLLLLLLLMMIICLLLECHISPPPRVHARAPAMTFTCSYT
jgi:hypothetical protein